MAAVVAGPNIIVAPPLISNTLPQNITFKNEVDLSTQDNNNNNALISEGYVVSGPVSQGVTPIFIAGGTKAVIALTPTTGDGAPFLKIWFPGNNTNKLYVTYCVASSLMADGYYDYTTGVPTAYFNALRAWINTNPSNGQPFNNISPQVRTRTFKFSAYGALTNKPQNAVTFFIKFTGTFQAQLNVVSGGDLTFGGGVAKNLS